MSASKYLLLGRNLHSYPTHVLGFGTPCVSQAVHPLLFAYGAGRHEPDEVFSSKLVVSTVDASSPKLGRGRGAPLSLARAQPGVTVSR